MSLDQWFSNGCIEFLYSKIYACLLKVLVILHICISITFYTAIEKCFIIILLLCIYVSSTEFCPSLIYYGLSEPGLVNLLCDLDGSNCS